MMEIIQECFESAFRAALLTAVVAVPVALVTLIVDQLVGRWMTARVRCWLWLIVAIRLLMPFAPGSEYSVQNIWSLLGLTSDMRASTTPEHPVTVSAGISPTAVTAAPISDIRSVLKPARKTPLAGVDWEAILVGCTIAVWFLGATVVMLRAIVASLRFSARIRPIPAVDDQQVTETVNRACTELEVSCPTIKRVPKLPAPALFCLWRPILCLPEEVDLTDSQLRMVALHEAMHLRRRDFCLAWLLTFVRAVHWFNPVAWFAVGQIEKYREQACDDAVRIFTNQAQHGAYADLLVSFAAGRMPVSNLGLLGLWFTQRTRRLRARIAAFTSEDRADRLPSLASGLVVVVLAVVGLTDALGRDGQNPASVEPIALRVGETDAWAVLNARAATIEPAPETNEVVERTYDLCSAIENADRIPDGQDRRQWVLDRVKAFGMLFNRPRPIICVDDNDPNLVKVTTTAKQHESVNNFLDDVSRFGHTYQVIVDTQMFRSRSMESLISIDWRKAVKFAVPEPVRSQHGLADESQLATDAPNVSMESLSIDYTPYTALVLDKDDTQKVFAHFHGHPLSTRLRALKVTVFNGQTAKIRDQSESMFVTGVHYIRGELATSVQPNITTINEGLAMDLQPTVIDDDNVELRCRLTFSTIDGVRNVKLPGQDVTVQAPRVTRRTVSTRCRLKRGESLLIAPLAGQSEEAARTYYYMISAHWFADNN